MFPCHCRKCILVLDIFRNLRCIKKNPALCCRRHPWFPLFFHSDLSLTINNVDCHNFSRPTLKRTKKIYFGEPLHDVPLKVLVETTSPHYTDWAGRMTSSLAGFRDNPVLGFLSIQLREDCKPTRANQCKDLAGHSHF